MKANEIGIIAKTYQSKKEIVVCEEHGKNCLNKFIKTRTNQPNLCLNCLRMLNLISCYSVEVNKVKANLWS